MNSAQSMPRVARSAKQAEVRPSGNQPAKRLRHSPILLLLAIVLMVAGAIDVVLFPAHSQTYTATAQVKLPSADQSSSGLSAEINPGVDSGVQPGSATIAPDPATPHLFTITGSGPDEDAARHLTDAASYAVVSAENQKLTLQMPDNPAGTTTAPQASIFTTAYDHQVKTSGATIGVIWQEISYALIALGAFGGILDLTLLSFEKIHRQKAKQRRTETGIDTIHTLVTASIAPIRKDRPVPAGGEHALVPTTENIPDDLFSSEYEKSALNLPVKTSIDQVLYERLAEYKRFSPDLGCVLLITETLPSYDNLATQSPYAILDGAIAALTFARTISSSRSVQTMIIDCGSSEWSTETGAVDLPDVPGFYDVIAGNEQLEDCLLLEDAVPGLTALASGDVPARWQEILASSAAESLIAKARAHADLVVIYSPRCTQYPDVVRRLAKFTNGTMIVSGVDADAEHAEIDCLEILNEAGIQVFGRIVLNTAMNTFDAAGIKIKNFIPGGAFKHSPEAKRR